MLEVRKLSKIYKTNQQTVYALNEISLKFQDKGMVFILGKSGSGKSTLLNILGGLDRFDAGEIFIGGLSSKDFKEQDFDSYRNTLIGFIFQEYNVIEQFSVKENIALALHLQGKEVKDESIENILKEVDLQGLEHRKPNELSGGQLQRVAIARALVKNPQIIMADEPTGALDSNTGKQVFETLKKLSKEKLVIVVSHDKEFAKQYGDRIIELADGHIVFDSTLKEVSNTNKKDDSILCIENLDEITEDSILKIIRQWKTSSKKIIISKDQTLNNRIIDKHLQQKKYEFQATENTDIVIENKDVEFIQSKLPFQSAFKLSLSNLKCKPFRLFMTILLSVCAFVLFGISMTLSHYQEEQVVTQTLVENQLNYTALKNYKRVKNYDQALVQLSNHVELEVGFQIQDFENIQKEYSQVNVKPVLDSDYYTNNFNILDQIGSLSLKSIHQKYEVNHLYGLSYINEEDLQELGYTLTGRLPESTHEIAVPKFMMEQFLAKGYLDQNGVMHKIESYEDMLEKELSVIVNSEKTSFRICGIIDTKFDLSPFVNDELQTSSLSGISNYVKEKEYYELLETGYHTLGYVSKEVIDQAMQNDLIYATYKGGDFYELNLEDMYSNFDAILDISSIDSQQCIALHEGNGVYVDYQAIQHMRMPSNLTLDEEVHRWMQERESSNSDAIKQVILQNLEHIQTRLKTIHYSSYTKPMKTPQAIPIKGIYIAKQPLYQSAIVMDSQQIKDYQPEPIGPIKRLILPISSITNLQSIVKTTYALRANELFPLLANPYMPIINNVNHIIQVLKPMSLSVAIMLAIFAALMFWNFLATSIQYQQQEIGILRAVGARSKDILKIYLNEAFMIASINWLFAILLCLFATNQMNMFLRSEFQFSISPFFFGILQMIELFLISTMVAYLGAAIPIYRIVRKKPIDAIKNRKQK